MLAAEYKQTRTEWNIESTYTHPIFIALTSDQRSKEHGYYISAAYRLNGWLEMGTYYSISYFSSYDKDGDTMNPDYSGWLEDYALSFRFDINEYWIAKIEGHLMDGIAYCIDIDNDNYKKNWWMFAAKITFSF